MKEKMRAASIYLFDEKGYSETSIQEIVDEIGVTKGTFYYYFNSKQELLKDINLTYIQFLLGKQEEILKENINYTEKLYRLIYMVISTIKTQRQSARVFFREMRHLSDEHLNIIKRKRNEFRSHFQKMLEEGIEAGEFNSNLRPDILTFGILGMTNWSYYWFNHEGEISEEELAKFYTDMLVNGIK
nr:TetR/AcrR family transcriptional regulator [Salirhabdus euzebyi]